MYSPKKKRTKKKPTTPQSDLIPSLPYDLLLNCIARTSRLNYLTLSQVSKSFRSLLASPELYKVRSLLGHTESCLYVCINTGSSKENWYTLYRKPDHKTLKSKVKKKSSRYVLAPVSVPHSPRAKCSDLVAVGSDIYNMVSSNHIPILDCKSNTWHEAPSLQLQVETEEFYSSACVVDEKIYLIRSWKDDDGSVKNTFNVFDTKTQAWDPVLVPFIKTLGKVHSFETACIDGKFHVVTRSKAAAYNSKEGRWDVVSRRMGRYMTNSHWSHCKIGNVLYSVSTKRLNHKAFRWYDTEVRRWRKLEGLVGLPNYPYNARVSLADYGGKMAVLWEFDHLIHENWPINLTKSVWCAVIELERRKSCEIWGKVEWLDNVLTVPYSYKLVKVLAPTL